MAASSATIVDAGRRDLRVSNPDRVIFPKTERSAAVTKLDVVNYYLAVGDGIMRALRERPTTLERWPKGVHPGMVISTRDWSGGDAFFQKRIPKGAPDYVQTANIAFPSGRTADEICPTEIAVVAWCAQMGTITFHPWPVPLYLKTPRTLVRTAHIEQSRSMSRFLPLESATRTNRRLQGPRLALETSESE